MSLDRFRLIDNKPLVDCATGRISADLLIKNGRWVCVQTGEIIPHTDIAIIGERIAYVGQDASHTRGPDTTVIDAQGAYLVPGLLDGHIHIESSMLTITEYTRVVLPHGTTGLFIDPHEIGNVFGIKGVKIMVDEAALQPIHILVQIPSCVPSLPGFETNGAAISLKEVQEALSWPGIIGLGEMMNFTGVIDGDEQLLGEMSATRRAGKVVGGHYPAPDLGIPFHAYAAGGAEDDHEGTRLEDAVARARQGMWVMMRYGSSWQDVVTQVRAITELNLDPQRFILCTDDAHVQTLYYEGHMDRVLRHAIAQGLPPMKAIQMATINTAEHFGLSREMGMIAPGRYADILIVKDLVNMHIDQVIARGKLAAENGSLTIPLPKMERPDWLVNSVVLPNPFTAADFKLSSNSSSNPLFANVIGLVENQAPTQHLRMRVHSHDGEVKADMSNDIAKIAVIERHTGKGGIKVGLVHGFGFKTSCAVASTVAHDSHNLIVVGTDDENMAIAVNHLTKSCGGQIVVKEGKVIALVDLPIAGLMSDDPATQVARKAASVLEGFRECGCKLNSPNMQLSLMALVVIPQLRISDLGLVDVDQLKFIDVFVKD
jgi:adenine deaminase